MFKERLKQEQPVAYKILENALKSGHFAHAYMFTGEKGTPKLQTAILMAQSLLCEEGNDFACETCNTCHRIAEHTYADFIFVDGETTSIKKQDILSIQEAFSKTAIEAKGKKIYLLNYAENATPDALNSLLKFLEEPVEDVYALLVVEQSDRLLPTIRSRCQNIPFKKVSPAACYERCIQEQMEPLDAYLLSAICGSYEEAQEKVEDEVVQGAKLLAMDTIQNFYHSPDQVLVNLQQNGFKDKKGADKQQFQLYIDMLCLFFKDCIKKQSSCQNQTWLNAMNHYEPHACIYYLSVCMEAKDKCTRSINISLLVDQLIARMKELKL